MKSVSFWTSWPGRPPLMRSRSAVLGFVFTIEVLSVSGVLATAQAPPPPHTPKPLLLPEANRPLDANQQMELREKNVKKVNFEAANLERKRQMTNDSDMLVTMAMALKAEVDNSSSTTLSPNAMRKAEMIEKLARGVKEKMKLTIGAN